MYVSVPGQILTYNGKIPSQRPETAMPSSLSSKPVRVLMDATASPRTSVGRYVDDHVAQTRGPGR